LDTQLLVFMFSAAAAAAAVVAGVFCLPRRSGGTAMKTLVSSCRTWGFARGVHTRLIALAGCFA
jgi:hypothetical protein